jgi:hypothetical protein
MKVVRIASAALALAAGLFGLTEAQTGPPDGGTSPGVRQACAADAARLCADAQDPQSHKQCMNAHKRELSEGCINARKASAHGGVLGDGGNLSAPTTAASEAGTPVTSDGGADTVAARIAARGFPSIFEAWSPVENLQQPGGSPVPLSSKESPAASIARHDLYWGGWQQLGLRLADGSGHPLLAPLFTPESIQVALRNRAALRATNPNIVILSEVHYHAALPNYLPADSPFWKRNGQNSAVGKSYGTQPLDLGNPQLQDKIAALCAALVKTGVYDGCMLDGWHDDTDTADRLSLIRKMRSAVGEQAILLGNVNQRLPSRTAGYLNGMYMEGLYSGFFPDWHLAAANLIWGEKNLHPPAIIALEGWWTRGRDQYPLMRQLTTLSLVFSNGYVLFSDPNELPTPDHLHDWYSFWNKSLGKATGALAVLDHPDLSGAYTRQFENGAAVFNPPSNHAVTVNFAAPRRSATSATTARSFTVPPGDGDLFLTP